MASEDIIIRLRPDGSQLDAQFVKSDQDLTKLYDKADSFKEQLKQWSIVVTGFNQALELSKKIVDYVQEPLDKAAEMEVLRSTFQGTAEDIELFRKATAGTVTEAGLIKLSNQATDLGISMKNQAIFFNMAEDAADKYGGSIEENFQKIVYASEGNTKGLKQLGIEKAKYEEIVKDLTKAHGEEISKLDADTQKQIRLQAILMASGQTLDDVNAKQADSKDRLEQIAVAAEEAKVKFGEMILPIAAQLEDLLIPALKGTVDNADKIVPVVKVASVAVAAYMVSTMGLSTAQNILSVSIARVKSALETLALYAMYNPWTVALVTISALVVALAQLNKYLNDNIEKTLENKNAQIQMNNAEISAVKSKKDHLEATQNLLKQYEELGKKTTRTKEEEEKYQGVINELNKKYPGLIKSGDDFKDNLERIRAKGLETTKQISQYGVELDKLTEKQKKFNIEQGQLKVDVAKKELENTLANTGNILNKASDFLFGSSSARDKAEEFIKEFAQGIYKAKDSDALDSALAAFQKKLKDTFGDKYAKEQLDAINAATKMRNEKEGLLGLYNSGGVITSPGTGGSTAGGKGSNTDKLDENIKDALSELNEKDQEQAVKSLEKTQAGLNMILEERNKVTLEGSEAYFKEQKRLEELQEKKRQIWADEKSQLDIQNMDNQAKSASQAELNRMLLNEETNLFNVEEQMRNAKTEAELQDLERTRNTTNEKINIIKSESQARQEAAIQMMQAGANQYDSTKNLGEQLREQARQNIMAIIAQAVMTYIGSIIASTGPLALILAPAAGMAIQALLNSIIPKFAKGGLVEGGDQIIRVNEDGTEFIANHRATQKYLPQLQAMNAGKDPFQSYSDLQNLVILQAVTAVKSQAEGIQMQAARPATDPALLKEIQTMNRNFEQMANDGLLAHALIGDREIEKLYSRIQQFRGRESL